MRDEYRAMQRELRIAQESYAPPEELRGGTKNLVYSTFEVAKHTLNQLETITDIHFSPVRRLEYEVGVVAAHAVSMTAYSLMADKHGLRLYLFGADKSPCELPAWTSKDSDPIRTETLSVWIALGSWSLATYLEENMDITPDRALRYGLSVLQNMRWHTRPHLALVDRRGRKKRVSFRRFVESTDHRSR